MNERIEDILEHMLEDARDVKEFVGRVASYLEIVWDTAVNSIPELLEFLENELVK
ncbi:MAG: hypothetical protein LBQ97_09965 [Fusobacteriaceae bacterium]|jgi:uncharacterized protein with HEPN domain|nr:hypothetical protein [Fusobacteriaceae bacterium]